MLASGPARSGSRRERLAIWEQPTRRYDAADASTCLAPKHSLFGRRVAPPIPNNRRSKRIWVPGVSPR